MLIVWGSKGFKKEEESPIYSECPCCNKENRFKLITIGKKFTLYWIPLFTTSKTRYLACPVCSSGRELTDGEYSELKNELTKIKKQLAGS